MVPPGVQRPDVNFARIWYITYGMTAFLSLPIDWVWGGWAVIATYLAVLGVGIFAGAEACAGSVGPMLDGTKTEFTFWKIKEPWARFLLGVWIPIVLWFRLPGATHWIAVPLAIWLPPHLTWWQVEIRVINWFKRRFS